MFRISWSTMTYMMAAAFAAGGLALAKDEPRRGRDKEAGASQGRVQAPKPPADPGRSNNRQPQARPNLPAPQVTPRMQVPKAEPRTQAPQINRPAQRQPEPRSQAPIQQQTPKFQLPRSEPRIQAPRNNPPAQRQPEPRSQAPVQLQTPKVQLPRPEPRTQTPRNNPPVQQQPAVRPQIQAPPQTPQIQLPRTEPRIQLPSNSRPNPRQPDNRPQIQPRQPSPQNPLPNAGPKVVVPQNDPPNLRRPNDRPNVQVPRETPKINLPPNTVPGVGTTEPRGRGDSLRPGGSGRGQGTTTIPGLTPNSPNTPNLRNVPQLDPKRQPDRGRSDSIGRGTIPGADNNQRIPGLGNQPGDSRLGNSTRGTERDRIPLRLDKPIAGAQRQTVPLHVPKIDSRSRQNLNSRITDRTKKPDQLESLLTSRDHRELRKNIDEFKRTPNGERNPQLANLRLDRISGLHQDRLQQGDAFQNWRNTNVGQRYNLDRQFQLQRRGDMTRQMDFSANVIRAGGWQNRHHGAVAASFTSGSFSVWYAGGGCYPTHCWYPRWSPWVDWCWWDTCVPFYDPRPIYCRPVIYDPCLPWVYYDYPVWQPLPIVTCGTWVDVEPIVVPVGLDLQMLAVRFVDNGHPEQNLGPRYRVWIRNNSPIQITAPFSALALAGNDPIPTADLPQSGVVIPTMDIGEVKPVDIRLPLQANRMGITPEGHRVPFNYLHILVDSHQQIAEISEANNGSVVARTDILPVDPAAFSTDLTAASPGTSLTIAGEGFGPEPGRVLISVGEYQTEAMIEGWYDLGIRFIVPDYMLTGMVDAEILVVRGDGAVANPLDIDLGPQTLIGQVQDIPAIPILDLPN